MTAVAVVYAIDGALNLFCAAVVLLGGAYIARMPDMQRSDRAAVGGIAMLLAFVIVLLGVPNLITAYGIHHRRYWGYVMGLVLAGINALWALASIFWGDVCSVFVCGSCAVFAFVVLLNSRYAAEFS